MYGASLALVGAFKQLEAQKWGKHDAYVCEHCKLNAALVTHAWVGQQLAKELQKRLLIESFA
jgi:hypothetical protein